VNDDIVTRDSVVELLERLIKEVQDGAPGWENTTLEAYLDALSGWLSPAEGHYRNNFGSGIPDNPWKVLRDALLAARTYE